MEACIGEHGPLLSSPDRPTEADREAFYARLRAMPQPLLLPREGATIELVEPTADKAPSLTEVAWLEAAVADAREALRALGFTLTVTHDQGAFRAKVRRTAPRLGSVVVGRGTHLTRASSAVLLAVDDAARSGHLDRGEV